MNLKSGVGINNNINNNINDKTNKSFKRIKDNYSNFNIRDEDYRKITKHIANKKETSFIESINSRIRHYLARLHRRTKCYSKSIDMLIYSLYLYYLKVVLAFGVVSKLIVSNPINPSEPFIDF